MEQEQIKKFLNKIKNNYKYLFKERESRENILEEITQLFHIPIDLSRKEDYVVTKINEELSLIEIIDQKNKISYRSKYTENAKLLHFGGGSDQFNEVTANHPTWKEESLFYIGKEHPIITRLTVPYKNYELVFEKENPHKIRIFYNDGVKFKVIYQKQDPGKRKQTLLTKTFKKCDQNKDFPYIFKQFYTYDQRSLIGENEKRDKYAYIMEDNVIYGINHRKQKAAYDLKAICLENTKNSLKKYFPYNLYPEEFPYLKRKSNSAMIFEEGRYIGNQYNKDLLQIYKTKDKIEILYGIEEDFPLKNETFKQDYYQRYELPISTKGKITTEEIQRIIDFLPEIQNREPLFSLTMEELETFQEEIQLRNHTLQEEDPLSPKKLIDLSFEELRAFVLTNKDACFELINQQFKEATKQSKQVQKVLK